MNTMTPETDKDNDVIAELKSEIERLRNEPLMFNSNQITERFCKLQAEVFHAIGDDVLPADCFCGKGGFWGYDRRNGEKFDGSYENGYRNSGVAVGIIEYIVREKLKRLTPPKQ